MANILVCDDDKDIVNAIEIYLQEDSHTIFKAYNGKEALDMLSGMNTGHAGMSTGHANSCRDMLRRIETMVWMGAADIPLEAIRQQIASALDLMVFVEKGRDGVRRILEIVEVGEVENGEVVLRPVMHREGEEIFWNR